MRMEPANAAQSRFFLLDQMEGSAARTLVKRIDISGDVNHARLIAAIRAVLGNAACLRASIAAVDGQLQVCEHDVDDVPIIVATCDESQSGGNTDLIQDLLTPFQHGSMPLCRILVLHKAVGATVYWAVHHAIFDDFSTPLLLDSLVHHYDSSASYATALVEPPRPSSGEEEALRSYWTEALRPLGAATSMPPPAAPLSRRRMTVDHPLDPSVCNAMIRAARQRGLTFFSQVAAASSVVLSWYLGQDEVVLMTASQPRWRLPAHGMGCYQNTLPIIVDVGSQATYGALAEHVQDSVLDAYEHGELPIEEIAAQMSHLRTTRAGKPLSDVVVVIVEQSRSVEAAGLKWALSELLPVDSEYPLTLTLVNSEGRPGRLRAEWLGGQFEEKTMETLLKHVQGALTKLLSEEEEKPATTILLDESEVGEIERLCVAPARLKEPATPLRTITEIASRHSAAVAITAGDSCLTYSELLDRVQRIAGSLRILGVGQGDRVALALPRDADLIPTMLGILWAGASFVPIDAEHPEKRIDQILSDAQPALLVSEELHRPGFMTRSPAELQDTGADCPCLAVPNQPMYILYTSGTTGQPKGVLIEHQAVHYFIDAIEQRVTTASASIIAAASLTFDASILDIFWPLMTGRQIYLTDHKRLLAQTLPRGAVYQCTPTIARTLVATTPGRQFLSSLVALLLSGEKVPPDLAGKLASLTRASIWNCYGPTETTVMSHVGKIERPERPAIGWPLAGASCHLVDPRGRPVPPGWPGKIVIGGTGLARSYWRRDELTQERFRPFPLLGLARAYDAGDLAILDRSLGFEVIGRTDNQIKIMGQRVETEEIELCIRELDWVADAAVAVVDTYLLAWVCKKGPEQASAVSPLPLAEDTQIRTHLARSLPAAIVPNKFFAVQSLPQLPSGKLDRQVLLDWAKNAVASEPTAPRDVGSTQQQVAAVWSSVLGREIGASDGFDQRTFFQLGGTSAGLIRAFDRLAQHYPSLALADLFEHTTLPALAAFLERQPSNAADAAATHGRERYQAIARFARHRQIKEIHSE